MSVRVPVSSEVGLFEFVQKICEYVVQPTNLPLRYRMEKTRFYGFGR